jgi:hypothetical protein
MSPRLAPRFAARLRDLMDQRGLSFRQLADLTHYSRSYLARPGQREEGTDWRDCGKA